MADKNEVAIKTDSNSPAEMIRVAVAGGADLEKLKGLLDLQERWEAREARKAYHIAMAEFKANPPEIGKDRTVNIPHKDGRGKTTYNHASLANVTDKISAELSKHGLSASWVTKQNGAVSVTCKITHIKGHSEETTLSAPADNTGSKNIIQAICSTITYLERYTLLALTGLATRDMDDDGKASANVELVSEKEVNQMTDYITTLKIDMAKFLEYMKIDKIQDMPKKDFKKAMAAIQQKKRVDGAK